MKNVFILILLFPQILFAQKELAVVIAEKAFASQGIDSGFKISFLNNLDTNAASFANGRIIKGVNHFKRMKDPGIKLFWKPIYAFEATSGELGFTTGPFEVKPHMDSNAIAFGQYHSIWKKNKDGEWKVIVDLGTEYNQSLFYTNEKVKNSGVKVISEKNKSIDYIYLDSTFIKDFEANGPKSIMKVITEESRLDIQGSLPIITSRSIEKAIDNIPGELKFKLVDGGMSNARDFAYAYGVVEYKNKKENYLRIWVHTTEGWKILLHVLKW